MAMQWSESLSVGVSEIDNQHKELIKRVNQLLDAMSQGKARSEIENVLSFLESYVVTHFGMEEKHMVQSRYPEYAAHKAQHTEFIKDFMDLKKDFAATGASAAIVIKLQRKVCDWLVAHISKTDMALGSYLKVKVQTVRLS